MPYDRFVRIVKEQKASLLRLAYRKEGAYHYVAMEFTAPLTLDAFGSAIGGFNAQKFLPGKKWGPSRSFCAKLEEDFRPLLLARKLADAGFAAPSVTTTLRADELDLFRALA